MRRKTFHEWNEGTNGRRDSVVPNPVKQQTPDTNRGEIGK